MNQKILQPTKFISFLLLSFVWLVACNNSSGTEIVPTSTPDQSTPTPEATVTDTPFAPPTTDPSIPLAAKINGQGITLAEYQAEVSLFQASAETGLTSYTEDDVLRNLIDQMLLAQGAREAGFTVDESTLQSHIAQLGITEEILQDWLDTYAYTREDFEYALARSIAAAWMRDQIIAEVPSTVEQVHARQILLYNSEDAEAVYAQLQAGADFETLATQYDPLASGELGWFPRGYLTVSELDEPVFALKAGEFTPIIETMLGFHIVQVIERDPQRPLSPGAYQVLQIQAIQNWLTTRHSQSEIEILLPQE